MEASAAAASASAMTALTAVIVDYGASLAKAARLREAGPRAEAIRFYEAASASRPDRVYPFFRLTSLLAESESFKAACDGMAAGALPG